ncbi:MAG: helix-turn-helix transcriptional regulator [Mycobacterium sp.]|nr:helix-turn-helix transcriptional regulator [Mycobacterium sp.]
MVDRLAATLSALADPTRRAIVDRLAVGELTVTELAEPFDMSLPAISRHLKVLQQAGLVQQRRDGQRRYCRLESRPLAEIAAWVEQYRGYWESGFDRLDTHLSTIQKGKWHGRNAGGNQPG